MFSGQVMYEGGHTHEGNGANEIAAQRAFLNFWLNAGIERAQLITFDGIDPEIVSTTAVSFTANTSGGSGNNSYEWLSSCGGTFSNPSSPASTLIVSSGR